MLIQSVLIQSVLIRLLRLASSCPWEPCAGPLPATVHSTTQSTVPTLRPEIDAQCVRRGDAAAGRSVGTA